MHLTRPRSAAASSSSLSFPFSSRRSLRRGLLCGHSLLAEEIENVWHLPDFERYRPKTDTKLLVVASRHEVSSEKQEFLGRATEFDASSHCWPPLLGGAIVSGASSTDFEMVNERLTSSDEEYEMVSMMTNSARN